MPQLEYMPECFVMLIGRCAEDQYVIIDADSIWLLRYDLANLLIKDLCRAVDPEMQPFEVFQPSVGVKCGELPAFLGEFHLHVSIVRVLVREILGPIKSCLQLS